MTEHETQGNGAHRRAMSSVDSGGTSPVASVPVPEYLPQDALVDRALRESPSVVVYSAEGVTTYRGIDGESGQVTKAWLAGQLDELTGDVPAMDDLVDVE